MKPTVNRELLRTAAFVRALRRFLKRRPQLAAEVEAALQMLSDDAFDPRLKAHKLSGELEGVWACSAAYNLRILFEFVEHEGGEAILLLTVGTHDEVY
jgi:mRNA-degrading endonuclease YafQ of YafQ-DinJ toxin-antitoxin module